MNCENVISKLGFSCRDLGGDTLRVWSPFSYAGDGEIVGLYVEKIPSGYRVTDGCEALMHAASMGTSITQARLDAVRRAMGRDAELSDNGEITAFVPEERIGAGMAAVLNAAMAVTHFQTQWKPRMRAETFLRNVQATLEDALGDDVLQKVSVKGASGHQLELPIAVKHGVSLIYVQPVPASDENEVDWQRVYEAWGRMSDIKNAGNQSSQRLVVLEESANDSEMNSAINLLTDSAPVVRYSKLDRWARGLRA